MIAGLRFYPAYKDSGVPWLGEVPTHWEVGPLKRFVARLPSAIKAGPFGSQLTADEMLESDVKVYTQRNVIDRNLGKGINYISSAKFEALRAFEVFPGDVLVTSRGTIGRTMLVTEDCERGVLHPCLIRIQPEQELLIAEFLMTLIQDSQLLPQQLVFLSNATTIDVIYSDTLANIVIPVPPLPEQTAIVRFLDHANRRIQRYIRAKQKLIALLEEQKQAIIHQAVTGQIDVRTGQPYPAYKPSGIEWLEEVPAHWEVRPLKAFSNLFGRIGFRGYSTSDLVEPGEGAITLSPSNLRNSQMDYSKCSYLSWSKYDESPEIQVHDGDILFVKTGATYGKTAIVSNLPEKATINPQLLVIKNIEADTTFIEWTLASPTLKAQIETAVIGGTIPTISQSKIGRLNFALPPTDEQQEIVSRVSKNYTPIDIAIVRANHEIDLLNEYRARLISDVVTGKLDIREAAATLPEVDPLAAEDPLDDTDAVGVAH